MGLPVIVDMSHRAAAFAPWGRADVSNRPDGEPGERLDESLVTVIDHSTRVTVNQVDVLDLRTGIGGPI